MSKELLHWANVQTNLASALKILGERESGTARLEQAMAAYREVLTVLTRDRAPLDWAKVQNDLSDVLRLLGERETGTTRLEEAVAACHGALTGISREHLPLHWAKAQNNLGNALRALGERESNTSRLDQAVAAYRDALKEMTRQRVPIDWAMTQNNLGSALLALGERDSGTARLEEAVAAYRNALNEISRDRMPVDWAKAQTNLGNALLALGERDSGTVHLEEAVAAYRDALNEISRERMPLDWAKAQHNLGNALRALGERESGTARLEEAVVAYRSALMEMSRERVPLLWAMVQNDLASVLSKQGDLAEARSALERVLAVYQQAFGLQHPNTAAVMNNLAGLLHQEGDLAGARSSFEQVLAVYEKAFGPEHPDTAIAISNLAYLETELGDLSTAKALFERALAIREQSLGAMHPDTARCLNNLADLFMAQGDLAGAQQLCERALAIRESSLDPDHPGTARTLNELATLLVAQGDKAAAQPLNERARMIWRSNFSGLLKWHLERGTRPALSPRSTGSKWRIDEFAHKCLISSRAVGNWCEAKTIPTNDAFQAIERALFGNVKANDVYHNWRSDLRHTYAAATGDTNKVGEMDRIRHLVNEIIRATVQRATREHYSEDHLKATYSNIFGRRPPSTMKPDKAVTYERLFGFGDNARKYLSRHPTRSVTKRHLEKISATLKELNIYPDAPQYHVRSSWLPFLDRTRNVLLDDPRVEGRLLSATARFAESLQAKIQRDDFYGRTADLEFLNRFLACDVAREHSQQFRWTLITGPAGAGKTRLAIQFLQSAETQGFRAGFIESINLRSFDAQAWQPSQPTVMVIDYAAQSPNAVAEVLKGFAARAYETGVEYPVRLLLLEREALGEWFKTIAPMDSTGTVVRSFCYRENESRWDYPLAPLSSEELLAIMRGRLPGGGRELSDESLLDTLWRIDPPSSRDDRQSGPRPLFAAATALKIADMMQNGDDTTAVTSKLESVNPQRKDVFKWLIERERTHFWIDGSAPDHSAERQRLRIHENLLAISTMALDMPREKYDDECPHASREYLPNSETLDEDRFRRMAGGDPLITLRRLEPDILGEFFVLDRLSQLPVRERQSLIDAGLTLGGVESAAFLVRCAIDFPEEWRDLGFLKPSIPGPATIAFAHAAVGWTYYLGRDRFEDVAAAISVVKELVDKYADPLLRELLACTLVNQGIRLGELERHDEAIAVYDGVVSRYGTAIEPALREQVAVALLNKGVALGELGRGDEELAVYDDIVSRYGTVSERALREEVAKALLNMGIALGKLGRAGEVLAVYDDIVSRYGTASEPTMRERVAKALVNKGGRLGALERHDEAIVVYDDIVSRYGAADEPALREQVAQALFNKGVRLGALDRHDEAIAVYDGVVSRYGTASEPALRELVAKALFNKGGTLGVLGRNDDAIGVYDGIVSRYGAASEPALRGLVADALVISR
jgi:tetratricopeptide (TPR) repeat protein